MRCSRMRWPVARLRLFAVIFSILFLAPIAGAQQGRSIDAYTRSVLGAHQYRQVAISPDGTRIAWVERLQDENRVPSGESAIWVTSSQSSGSIRRIRGADGDHAEHSVAWSPDSRELAFLSDAAGRGSFNST